MPNTPQKRRSKRVNQAKIRVFLSWSKSISKELASILKTWLPKILQNVIEPYFSDTDIEAGDEWLNNLHLNLSETDCGIFCITDENLSSVWMHYEAGAMIGKDYICPFLFGVSKKELISPLNNRQCVEFLCDVDGTNEEKRNAANRKAFWKLVDRLSKICDNKGIETDKDTLSFTFNLVYDQHIQPALEELSKRAQERKREAETKQAQADEIIAQAYELMAQANEHYSRAFDVARRSQSLNLSAPPGGAGKSGAKTEADQIKEVAEMEADQIKEAAQKEAKRLKEEAKEEALRHFWRVLPASLGIMGEAPLPWSFSLELLAFWIDILKNFPSGVLSKSSKPDENRQAVINEGMALIKLTDSIDNDIDADIYGRLTKFRAIVKQNLDTPYCEKNNEIFQVPYNIPVSLGTARNALYGVIDNMSLSLKKGKGES